MAARRAPADRLPASVIEPEFRIGLSRTEAASLIGVSPGTFDGMVERGEMPKAKRIGARRVWSRAAIERAFDALPTGEVQLHREDRTRDLAQDVDRRPPWERRAS